MTPDVRRGGAPASLAGILPAQQGDMGDLTFPGEAT
jgi:hypothetical protein